MAATKVWKENNFLHIEVGGTPLAPRNAQLVYIASETGTHITLEDNGRINSRTVEIAFSDFQDVDGTPVGNRDACVTYLSDKIG